MLARAQAFAINRSRRIARRPRAWIRAARSHGSTQTAKHVAQNLLARGALSARSIPGRRGRRDEFATVVADVASLPPAPAPVRSV
ncbi:MAG: hypothetical protein QOH10_795, partial [Actinomycetota bacterium]|nr:hypothetical protein [Actinomycetota bacterium]